MGRTSRKKSKPKLKRNGFALRDAGSRKIKAILKDIDEARELGVELRQLSLADFYHYLTMARAQSQNHRNAGRSKDTFVFDDHEDTQNDWPNSLDDLRDRVNSRKKPNR